MSKFTDIVQQDTPRLVVMFRQDGDKEMFQWGVVGNIPLVSLVGYVVRVQAELAFRAAEECPELALVIAWNNKLRVSDDGTYVRRGFDWFVHPDVPVDSLVGMLETIKTVLVDTHMARHIAAQQLILGPDGQPMRR